MPYHDSYTYSIFSKDNIAKSVQAFLSEAASSQDWVINEKSQLTEEEICK